MNLDEKRKIKIFNEIVENSQITTIPLFMRIFGDNEGLWYSLSLVLGLLNKKSSNVIYTFFMTWEIVYNTENEENHEMVMKSFLYFILGIVIRNNIATSLD